MLLLFLLRILRELSARVLSCQMAALSILRPARGRTTPRVQRHGAQARRRRRRGLRQPWLRQTGWSRFRRLIPLEQMRRCFRLGQLGRDAQPSLVDAQIADLSHEEPWVEHVRGYEEDIAGGLARDFVAGA